MSQPRRQALWCLLQVLEHGHSLSTALPEAQQRLGEQRDKALCQELSFGVLRYHSRLNWLAAQLLRKRFKPHDQDLALIVEMALYQIFQLRVPDYAAVNSAIELVKWRDKGWAKGLVNGVLRNAIRQRSELQARLEKKEVALYSQPAWILKQLKHDWPQHWRDMAAASLQRPPMSLRINRAKTDRARYADSLHEAGIAHCDVDAGELAALNIDPPVDVEQLPGFRAGEVSVQDVAAQLAAPLLAASCGERVLDACAAPGGKTGHILELAPDCQLTAVELEATRIGKIDENLQRIGGSAQVIEADLRHIEQWWDGVAFDRILLDAPCSATGVIRRHPDIKLLREPEDIDRLAELQAECLQAVWPSLKPGGYLLYATCSVFKQENQQQIARFLQQHGDAQLQTLSLPAAIDTGYGYQLLPGNTWNSDGFFYALLQKRA